MSSISSPTSEDWTSKQLVEEVERAIQFLGWEGRSERTFGPFLIIFSSAWARFLHDDWFEDGESIPNCSVISKLRMLDRVSCVEEANLADPEGLKNFLVMIIDERKVQP